MAARASRRTVWSVNEAEHSISRMGRSETQRIVVSSESVVHEVI